MTAPRDTETAEGPLLRDILQYCRARLGNRRSLLVLAAAGAFAAIMLNWSWLVALGIVPFLVAVLPCLVMCGLGLCMNRLTGSAHERCSLADDPDLPVGSTTRLDAGASTKSVPLVCRQTVRRRCKQPSKRQTRVKATSGKET